MRDLLIGAFIGAIFGGIIGWGITYWLLGDALEKARGRLAYLEEQQPPPHPDPDP